MDIILLPGIDAYGPNDITDANAWLEECNVVVQEFGTCTQIIPDIDNENYVVLTVETSSEEKSENLYLEVFENGLTLPTFGTYSFVEEESKISWFIYLQNVVVTVEKISIRMGLNHVQTQYSLRTNLGRTRQD